MRCNIYEFDNIPMTVTEKIVFIYTAEFLFMTGDQKQRISIILSTYVTIHIVTFTLPSEFLYLSGYNVSPEIRS